MLCTCSFITWHETHSFHCSQEWNPFEVWGCYTSILSKRITTRWKYVLTPPHGCPKSKPNTYWLLLWTLYGLKRSPRHWYDHAVKLLAQCGLKSCPQSPCIFHGHPIPGKSKLYLGLYVDDFVYFSTDPLVETHFKQQLSSLTDVHFMGQVS